MSSDMSNLDRQETWEIQVPGKVTVWKRNRRTGDYGRATVSGEGPKILHISTDDRLYNQELIPEENARLDPFTNGSLALREDGELKGITVVTLRELLTVNDPDLFREALDEHVDNELTIRRLLDLATSEGTVPQVEVLRDIIDERYKVGGTQRTVREMMQESEGGEVLTG